MWSNIIVKCMPISVRNYKMKLFLNLPSWSVLPPNKPDFFNFSRNVWRGFLFISVFTYIDIFVNCNWVYTRWQYRTHLHINNTQDDTTQTIHRTTQHGRVRAVPHLCELYPGICLTTEENHGKTCQGSRRVPAGTMNAHNHTIRIHRHNNKNT
jgi:hypothetical protein